MIKNRQAIQNCLTANTKRGGRLKKFSPLPASTVENPEGIQQ